KGAQFADGLQGESLVLIPLEDVRTDFGFREFAYGPAKLNLLRGEFEIHDSDDLFGTCVPVQGAALAIAVDGHTAGDRNAESDVEGAIGLLAVADAIEEILHVGVGTGFGIAQDFYAVGPIHFLRDVADLLAFRNGAIRSEDVFGAA